MVHHEAGFSFRHVLNATRRRRGGTLPPGYIKEPASKRLLGRASTITLLGSLNPAWPRLARALLWALTRAHAYTEKAPMQTSVMNDDSARTYRLRERARVVKALARRPPLDAPPAGRDDDVVASELGLAARLARLEPAVTPVLFRQDPPGRRGGYCRRHGTRCGTWPSSAAGGMGKAAPAGGGGVSIAPRLLAGLWERILLHRDLFFFFFFGLAREGQERDRDRKGIAT